MVISGCQAMHTLIDSNFYFRSSSHQHGKPNVLHLLATELCSPHEDCCNSRNLTNLQHHKVRHLEGIREDLYWRNELKSDLHHSSHRSWLFLKSRRVLLRVCYSETTGSAA